MSICLSAFQMLPYMWLLSQGLWTSPAGTHLYCCCCPVWQPSMKPSFWAVIRRCLFSVLQHEQAHLFTHCILRCAFEGFQEGDGNKTLPMNGNLQNFGPGEKLALFINKGSWGVTLEIGAMSVADCSTRWVVRCAGCIRSSFTIFMD